MPEITTDAGIVIRKQQNVPVRSESVAERVRFLEMLSVADSGTSYITGVRILRGYPMELQSGVHQKGSTFTERGGDDEEQKELRERSTSGRERGSVEAEQRQQLAGQRRVRQEFVQRHRSSEISREERRYETADLLHERLTKIVCLTTDPSALSLPSASAIAFYVRFDHFRNKVFVIGRVAQPSIAKT